MLAGSLDIKDYLRMKTKLLSILLLTGILLAGCDAYTNRYPEIEDHGKYVTIYKKTYHKTSISGLEIKNNGVRVYVDGWPTIIYESKNQENLEKFKNELLEVLNRY